MPLRLITWNIHVSFSAPKCRDKKDWVRLYGSFLLQWIVYLHIYFLKKYFTKLQSWNFRFHQALNEMDHIWYWKNRGRKPWKNVPISNFPLQIGCFCSCWVQAQSHKDSFKQNPTAPTAEATKIVVFAVVLCFFSGTQPGLVARLYNKAQPKGKSTAEAPGRTSEILTWATLFVQLWDIPRFWGEILQRLVPSQTKDPFTRTKSF